MLVIRADADATMGAGHVMRCFALALTWARKGGSVFFCSRIADKFMLRRLEKEGFRVIDPGSGPEETIDILRRAGLQRCRIVLDGYHFGSEWQERLVAAGFPVLLIDDGARLPRYQAPIILAPEHDAAEAAYHASDSTMFLTGPRFRLLNPDLIYVRRDWYRRSMRGRVVLVTFGGADSANVTRSILANLEGVLGPQDKALILLGPLNRHYASIRRALATVTYNFELLRSVEDMFALYTQSDLAVCAAGGGAWEMAATGLPAILLPVADNQRSGASYLARAGAAIELKGIHGRYRKAFRDRLRFLLRSPRHLQYMSKAGPRVCDGRGAERVAQILMNADRTESQGNRRPFDGDR